MRFPLGSMTKPEVRALAEVNGFVNARKRDSQDICFVPDRDYAKFVDNYDDIKTVPGNFVDNEGNKNYKKTTFSFKSFGGYVNIT